MSLVSDVSGRTVTGPAQDWMFTSYQINVSDSQNSQVVSCTVPKLLMIYIDKMFAFLVRCYNSVKVITEPLIGAEAGCE